MRQFGQGHSYIYEPTEAAWQQSPTAEIPKSKCNAAMHLPPGRGQRRPYGNAARIHLHEDGERQVVSRHDGELRRAYSLHTERDWLQSRAVSLASDHRRSSLGRSTNLAGRT